MDFFEAQDAARRKTAWLGVLFLGAVLSLIALTNAAVGITLTVASEGKLTLSTLPPSLWAIISGGVLVIIFIGSAIQAFRLRAGGASVAVTLGGRLVTEETTDPLARRAQNIVEEMALAAGIPVPPLYIIPEAGINAFAAGFGLKDAVIGINQGTLEALNRDELQGVIAHEFSHIVNGDMGINIRLMALLHGILMISVAGRVLMHARGSGRQRDSAAQVVALGFALLVIGYSGVFFGRLIKASISRQREFLADAAAVQFTRNPQGIGNALRRIGGAQGEASSPTIGLRKAVTCFSVPYAISLASSGPIRPSRPASKPCCPPGTGPSFRPSSKGRKPLPGQRSKERPPGVRMPPSPWAPSPRSGSCARWWDRRTLPPPLIASPPCRRGCRRPSITPKRPGPWPSACETVPRRQGAIPSPWAPPDKWPYFSSPYPPCGARAPVLSSPRKTP